MDGLLSTMTNLLGPFMVVFMGAVVMFIVMACGTCRYCRDGRSNLCLTRTTMSYQHDGAFAQYVKIPAAGRRQLYKVPEHIPATHAAICEPLSSNASMTSVRPLYLMPAAAVAKRTPSMRGNVGKDFGASGETATGAAIEQSIVSEAGRTIAKPPRDVKQRATSRSQRG